MYCWPGPEQENILICVHKSSGVQELFHRHDFFYFNYTYKGEYDSLSYKYDHQITIRERELYAGQPLPDTPCVCMIIRKPSSLVCYSGERPFSAPSCPCCPLIPGCSIFSSILPQIAFLKNTFISKSRMTATSAHCWKWWWLSMPIKAKIHRTY